jgi:hypothetical protein
MKLNSKGCAGYKLGGCFAFHKGRSSLSNDPEILSIRRTDDCTWKALISGLEAGFASFNRKTLI